MTPGILAIVFLAAFILALLFMLGAELFAIAINGVVLYLCLLRASVDLRHQKFWYFVAAGTCSFVLVILFAPLHYLWNITWFILFTILLARIAILSGPIVKKVYKKPTAQHRH